MQLNRYGILVDKWNSKEVNETFRTKKKYNVKNEHKTQNRVLRTVAQYQMV